MTGDMGRPRRAAVAAAVALAVVLTSAGEANAHPGRDRRVADLDARVAAEPRRSDLRLQRGRLYAEAHDWGRARADFERSLKLDPTLAEADFELARVEIEAGRPRRAMGAIERYLAARPGDAGGLALRGAVRGRLGDRRAAAEDYGLAIAARRASGASAPPEWSLARARLFRETGTEAGTDLALAALEEGLADLGGPVVLEWEALGLERTLRRFDAALARADRMAGSSGQPAPWLAARGEILEEAGRTDEARASYLAALGAYDALPAPRRSPPAVERRVEALREALARLDRGTEGR